MAFSESREIAELKQRIRRVLFVFRSMAAHMGGRSENTHDSALHLSGRISAIARAVLIPPSFGGVDLESLFYDELLAHAVQRQRLSICGIEVRLDSKSAELMSLVIHELATNSLKFGALSQPQARLRILWRLVESSDSTWLKFEWLETGVRMNIDLPRTPGFGAELIEKMIASELRGEGRMMFLAEGVHYTIEFPLTVTHE